MTATEHPAATTGEPGTEPPAAAAPTVAWLRRHGVLLAALALIVAQLAWNADILRHGYFAEDDFEFMARAADQGFGWDYLMRNHGGHLMPGSFALAWLVTRAGPHNWGLASAITLALQLCAGLAMLHLLRVLFGSRPAILVPLVGYLFTPMTVPAMSWWAAALNVVPFQVTLPMALAAHVQYVRTDRFRYAVAAAGWVVAGMAVFLKAAAVPVLLFALTSMVLIGGPWLRGIREALSRHARAWVLYGGVLVGYAVVYLVQRTTATTEAALPSSSDMTLDFGWRLLVRTFIPSALGGPWEWRDVSTNHALAEPPAGLVVLAVAVAAALVAASLRYRRQAGRVWLLLLGYLVVVDVLPVLVARLAAWGPDIGLETRYVADAAPLLAMCIGLAFLPMVGESEPYRRPLPSGPVVPVVCGLLIGAFTVGAAVSVTGFRNDLDGDRIRNYLATARKQLATVPATAEIHNQKVPRYLMLPDFGEYADTAKVLEPLAPAAAREAMAERPPYRDPMIFDDNGWLRPMAVLGTHTVRGFGNSLGERCWTATGSTVDIPLPTDVADAQWMVRIGYLASKPSAGTVRLGGERVNVRFEQGLGQVFVELTGGGANLQVAGVDPAAGICVGEVTVGIPRPKGGS